jgi:diguanylate cyclase (GGDEF)-like protein
LPETPAPAQAIFDRSGQIRAWNEAFCHAPKNVPDDPGGASIFSLLPQIDAGQWSSAWAEIDAGKEISLGLTTNPENVDGIVGLTIRKFFGDQEDWAIATFHIGAARVNRDRLHRFQHEALEAVATGWSLRQIADLICRRAEELAPDAICSVLTIDAEKRLRPLAAPRLPRHYCEAIDGLAIGPNVGSCGTALYRGEAVIVTDIASDPLWADFKDIALPLGLRACWSSPIIGRNGKVAGTFAFYYRTPRGPDRLDQEIVDICVHLCAIAIEHEATQSHIQKLALCDPLTDLPNRAHFQRNAGDLIKVLPMSDRTLALLYIDLDDFKAVNDTLGHWVGDLLLKAISDRFRAICQTGEFVARIGGDEFAVLQFPVRQRDEIDCLANRLLSCFLAPFEIENRKITIGASIGIACAPANGLTSIELLKRADLALYHAKRSGGNSYNNFTEEMDRTYLSRREMEEDLRHAIGAEEITIHYQPIVNLATGEATGFEALARWQHPRRGMVMPGEFIPLAEDTGLIGALGNYVLANACRQAVNWPANFKVAVNLSPSQLARPNFRLEVITILNACGLSPLRLELEITESVRLIENAAMRDVLHDLRALGIGIALDDFGTGYSSLGYLQSFPFDKIKIDLSFIQALGDGGPAEAIVDALLTLANNLGKTTTAEGIESNWQREWLRDRGCSEGQGYFFSCAMPALDLTEFLGGSPTEPGLSQTA